MFYPLQKLRARLESRKNWLKLPRLNLSLYCSTFQGGTSVVGLFFHILLLIICAVDAFYMRIHIFSLGDN